MLAFDLYETLSNPSPPLRPCKCALVDVVAGVPHGEKSRPARDTRAALSSERVVPATSVIVCVPQVAHTSTCRPLCRIRPTCHFCPLLYGPCLQCRFLLSFPPHRSPLLRPLVSIPVPVLGSSRASCSRPDRSTPFCVGLRHLAGILLSAQLLCSIVLRVSAARYRPALLPSSCQQSRNLHHGQLARSKDGTDPHRV
jgi:hypothetical protein